MSKKLFIVRAEIESVVLAEDENDACVVAAYNRRDILDEADLYSTHSWDALLCKRLPQNWDDNSLPWGSDDDSKTVGFFMKATKAVIDQEAQELAEDIMDNLEIDD